MGYDANIPVLLGLVERQSARLVEEARHVLTDDRMSRDSSESLKAVRVTSSLGVSAWKLEKIFRYHCLDATIA